MIEIKKLHHIAIICSDYQRSKDFYTQILGFKVEGEYYREERQSYKTDLSLNGEYLIELFSFPNPPQRASMPEATGLRHIAFVVEDLDEVTSTLATKGIAAEPIRVDEFTGRRFTFIQDPDKLPIEFYEVRD